MLVPLVLFAYPPRKNETCCDEEHYQWDWPKRISKPAPQPEKDRNQQQRKKQREQVSQQVSEHHSPIAASRSHWICIGGGKTACAVVWRGGGGSGAGNNSSPERVHVFRQFPSAVHPHIFYM